MARRPYGEEHRESWPDLAGVTRSELGRHDAQREGAPYSRDDALPGLEVAHVAGLQLSNGEYTRRILVRVQIVRWFSDQFGSAEPRLSFSKRHAAFQHERVRDEIDHVAGNDFTSRVDTVRERRGPDVIARHPMVRGGRGEAIQIGARLRGKLRFRLVEVGG